MLCACPLLAADDHHHPDDHSQKLGTVSFTISCAAGVQKPFEHGVVLLHSFWYGEAEKQFKVLEKKHPGCAIIYWDMPYLQVGEDDKAEAPRKF
jgi:hypothetical protein